MKIAGVWSGHDCSYCVFENGKPIIHNEYERFIREKEPKGDSIKFLIENYEDYEEIKYLATASPLHVVSNHSESWELISKIVEKNGGKIYEIGHHEAHAANAFFSSNFNAATIVTLDGGGVESDGFVTACTVWKGSDNGIKLVGRIPIHTFNIGGLWTRATRYIFKLQSGWPRGHQAGSVMAMSAFGDSSRFLQDFLKMLTTDIHAASFKPPSQPKGAYIPGGDPTHPYLDPWAKIAENSEKDKFDLAAGLQAATEIVFRDFLQQALKEAPNSNLCLAGGVTLNSVMTGKICDWFPEITGMYVTPTPHDGGLPIGAVQYVWHQVLGNPREKWSDNFTPYLGKTYDKSEIEEALVDRSDISWESVTDDDVLCKLNNQKIVSIFGGGSESGRRALGNRSILADPRNEFMKDIINDKVKHRQWFRPFAPSILVERAQEWFENSVESPYMSAVLQFKKEKQSFVPAVVHINGSARLQTVSKNDNEWYHNFLEKWENISGVPIILNTSFNDREPICETPAHALECFCRTEIDYLYFYDYGILVHKI